MTTVRAIRIALAVAVALSVLRPASAAAAAGAFVAGSIDPVGVSAPSDGTAEPVRGGAAAFVPPVPIVVVTPFRPPASRYGPGHRGVDLAAAPGTVVRAAGAGVVVFAGRLARRGVVSIEHDGGLRTTYEPVDASVEVGAAVQAGDAIGTLAAGHESCAPESCLHFGARMPDRVYLDPLALLRPWQVRLKPWAGLTPKG